MGFFWVWLYKIFELNWCFIFCVKLYIFVLKILYDCDMCMWYVMCVSNIIFCVNFLKRVWFIYEGDLLVWWEWLKKCCMKNWNFLLFEFLVIMMFIFYSIKIFSIYYFSKIYFKNLMNLNSVNVVLLYKLCWFVLVFL